MLTLTKYWVNLLAKLDLYAQGGIIRSNANQSVFVFIVPIVMEFLWTGAVTGSLRSEMIQRGSMSMTFFI